jgi:Co/Zn/Cd efflux system component
MAQTLRTTVLVVAAINLAYFGVEFGVAQAIGSVSLFADSVDFLEDASVNLLVFLALGWSLAARARIGAALAFSLLVPGVATLLTVGQKLVAPLPPDPVALGLTALGALATNLFCALILARVRNHGGSLSRAAFLSARNDAIANVGILAAGLVTATLWHSAWPDLIVGLAIAALNAAAARAVWTAARNERQQARA